MRQQVSFDADLVRRYDVAGPRYTSYPTAQNFHEGFDAELYRRHVRASNDELIPVPLSLYVHLPFCHSLCYYCGCTKKVTRNKAHGTAYLERLEQEIMLQSGLFDRDRLVVQLHLGGGTPTFFDDLQLQQLMHRLRSAFSLDDSGQREFAIEIDPRTVSAERLQALAGLGFNRISLGVQDTNPDVQQAVNRIQDTESTLQLVEQSRQLGFNSVSLDLIYGLPKQTPASFENTLDTVIATRPDRLAVFNYAHMPHIFRSQRMIHEPDLPAAETRLALLELTIRKLTAAGYLYIGMDHFALPQDELSLAQQAGHLHRNFQGYSTRAECDLVGLGSSAIGKVGECYVQNLKDIPRWSDLVAGGELPVWRGFSLSAEDGLRRRVIDSIMCQGQLDFAAIESEYLIDFTDYFAPEMNRLQKLADDGLLLLEENGVEVTPAGRLLLRCVAMVFDQYLAAGHMPQPRFSRII